MKLLIKISFSVLIASLILVTGCGQKDNIPVDQPMIDNQSSFMNSNSSFLQKHGLLPQATLDELQEARIATGRYHNLNNAKADGYEDINVFVPHMGYHYLKSAYLDSTFEPDKPELLVYTPWPDTSHMRLVAVEYAVPVSLSPDPPAGFTGNYDTWDFNSEFQLWTCHAWIWYYNPDGVFNDTNPLINP